MAAVYTHLAVYLNDHLAGAVGALEILDSLTARTDTPGSDWPTVPATRSPRSGLEVFISVSVMP